MSKHGKKRGRKARKRSTGIVTLCEKCMSTQEITPDLLMTRLADALNALDAVGMRVRVRSEFIIAEGERGGGFILPPLGRGGWTRHMQTYNPSVPHLTRREDDLDS